MIEEHCFLCSGTYKTGGSGAVSKNVICGDLHHKFPQIKALGAVYNRYLWSMDLYTHSTLRMWDMSALIRRCENFGPFYSFCSQLAEASGRQT